MITSFSNPLVKRIKHLRQKKYRQREGVFLVEGIRPVLAAIAHNAGIELLLYAPDLLTSAGGREAVEQYQSAGGQVVTLAGPVFAAISEREHPVGLAAIVQEDLRPLSGLQELVTTNAVFAALVEVSDPGNLGAILRTADAVNASGVILVGDTVDPYHPTAVKASMGAVFSVPLAAAASPADLWDWAGENQIHTLASSAHAHTHYRESEIYRFPLLLWLGSEGEGLPEIILGRADSRAFIPMLGDASSLNLAVAAGLFFYEAAHNRPQPGLPQVDSS